jgi:hypothetical protein
MVIGAGHSDNNLSRLAAPVTNRRQTHRLETGATRPIGIGSKTARPFRERVGGATLAGVFFVAFAVRLFFCFVVVPRFDLANGPQTEDFWTYTDGYVDLAKNLVEHGKYSFAEDAERSTYRAPLFPFVLAGVYRLFGDMATSVLVLNSAASSLGAVIALIVASHFIPRISRFAAYSVALLPFSIWYCPSSYSDTFLALTVLLFVWALVCMIQQPRLRNKVATGVAFALACLTKAILLPFPAVVLAWALIRKRSHLGSMILAFLLGMSLISVWSVRNYQLTGRFVTISQGMGFNLLAGNYMLEEWTDSTASFQHAVKKTMAHLQTVTGKEVGRVDIRPHEHFDLPVELDRLCGQLAKQQFREQPALAFEKLCWNSIRFWYFTVSPERCALAAAMNFPLVALGIVGLIRWRRNSPDGFEAIGLFMMFFVGTYSLIIVSGPRFNLPLLLLFTPFAAEIVCRAISGESSVADGERFRSATRTGFADEAEVHPASRGAVIAHRLQRPIAVK